MEPKFPFLAFKALNYLIITKLSCLISIVLIELLLCFHRAEINFIHNSSLLKQVDLELPYLNTSCFCAETNELKNSVSSEMLSIPLHHHHQYMPTHLSTSRVQIQRPGRLSEIDKRWEIRAGPKRRMKKKCYFMIPFYSPFSASLFTFCLFSS